MNREVFSQRLKRARIAAGLSQTQLSRALDITPPSITLWETGKTAPRPDKLARLAAVLSISQVYLTGDSDDPTPPPTSQPITPNTRPVPPNPNLRGIPVVSWARAGELVEFEDLCTQIEEWVDSDTRDPNAFALEIEGDSMEPQVTAGDFVVLEPNSMPRNGNLVAAKIRDEGVVFKRFKQTGPEGRTVVLESFNPDYSPMERSMEDFEWIYPAVDLHRKLRF